MVECSSSIIQTSCIHPPQNDPAALISLVFLAGHRCLCTYCPQIMSGPQTQRVHSSDADPENPKIRAAEKIARSLTVYAQPQNIANVETLLAMYRFDVEEVEGRLSHENLKTLLTAADYCQLPQVRKPALKAQMEKRRQWRDEGMRLLPLLRERVEALEEALRLVHQPQLFQAKMELYTSRYISPR